MLVRSFAWCLFVTTQVFLRFCNRQQQKRAKPPLGTTGVPTFFLFPGAIKKEIAK
jgi:hypothetical protein